MLTCVLPIRPQEILRLLEAEIAQTHRQPELYHDAWEDYLIEEDFDRARYGIADDEAGALGAV
jgi:hypothetical protein